MTTSASCVTEMTKENYMVKFLKMIVLYFCNLKRLDLCKWPDGGIS